MWETIRIVEELKPKYVIWENVKNLIGKKHKHNFDAYLQTMEEFGYNNYYQVLNSKNYGIPQNRERIFTVSIRNDIKQDFKFPPKQELKLKVKDILETNVNHKYQLTESNKKNLQRDFGCKGKEIIVNKEAPTLTASMGTGGGNIPYFNIDEYYYKVCPSMLKALDEGKVKDISNAEYSQTITTKQARWNNAGLIKESRYRYLTEKECFNLMGFDNEDYDKASQVNKRTQLYKQAGNSIVVNVIEAIYDELLKDYQ